MAQEKKVPDAKAAARRAAALAKAERALAAHTAASLAEEVSARVVGQERAVGDVCLFLTSALARAAKLLRGVPAADLPHLDAVMIDGPSGCGKTYMVRLACEALGLGMHEIDGASPPCRTRGCATSRASGGSPGATRPRSRPKPRRPWRGSPGKRTAGEGATALFAIAPYVGGGANTGGRKGRINAGAAVARPRVPDARRRARLGPEVHFANWFSLLRIETRHTRTRPEQGVCTRIYTMRPVTCAD